MFYIGIFKYSNSPYQRHDVFFFFSLISASDIISIKELTLILKIIGQSNVKNNEGTDKNNYYIIILFKHFYWLSCCHLTFRKIGYCFIKTRIDLVSLSFSFIVIKTITVLCIGQYKFLWTLEINIHLEQPPNFIFLLGRLICSVSINSHPDNIYVSFFNTKSSVLF